MAVPGRKALKGCSSTMSRGSCEDFDLICQPCDVKDLRFPAFGFCCSCQEHLCDSCFKHHKTAIPSRYHILVDKNDIVHVTQNLSISTHSGQSEDFTKPCSKHTKEMLKFYCHDHRALLCSVCVTLTHTPTVCSISYIPDVAEETLNSKEFADILIRINTLTEKCNIIPTNLKQITAKSNTSLTDVLTEIKMFRDEINQRLDKLEKAADDARKTIQQENDTRLQAAETTCNDAIESLNATSEAIKQLNSSKQVNRLFMELKSAEQMIQDKEEDISILPPPEDVKEYHLQPNSVISTCLRNEKSLGTLKQKITKPSTSLTAPEMKTVQIAHQGAINVKTPQDKTMCWITGMVFQMPSRLIFTDKNNKTIRMADIKSDSITAQLEFDAEPFKVTTITTDQLAVTLPDKQKIQFLSASSNRLSLKHALEVDGQCCGISYCKKKLVVTFVSPPKLEIMDLTGKVLTAVRPYSDGEIIFSSPYNVTSNSSNIYVADEKKCKVFMLNWQGELTGSYGGVTGLGGIAMLEDGSLLLSDYCMKSIHYVSGDLTKGQVVLKELEAPYALCLCGKNKSLFISSYTQTGEKDNLITRKFFKMK